MKVKIEGACENCCYFSSRTETCDFALINHKSRLYTNGVRIEDGYCDKFVKGKRDYDGHDWKNGVLI